jgi:RNA polymerase sigma factor (TIGR02999 family)
MGDVTGILARIESGDPLAADQLLPLVYDELRRLARRKLSQEKPGQTLQPTALVHEAYLRLVGSGRATSMEQPHWQNRRHFFEAAAEAMRRILVESARRKKRIRHGGAFERVELGEDLVACEKSPEDVLSVDEALDQLATDDPEFLTGAPGGTATAIDSDHDVLISPRILYRDDWGDYGPYVDVHELVVGTDET